MSRWKRVCAVSEIPENHLRKFDIDGVELIVANPGEGIRVFPPFCPHMREPLHVSGMLEGGVLTCSKHLWQWNLNDGTQTGLAEVDLLMYETKEEDGELLVDLAEELAYEWEEEDELEDDDFFGSD